jgi:hypothetical protein
MTIARGRAARDPRRPACLLFTNWRQASPGERSPRWLGSAQAGLNRCLVRWQRRSTSAVVAAGRRTPSAPGLPSAAPPGPTSARHGELDPFVRAGLLRHRLIRVPARLVRHGGAFTLRLPPGHHLLDEVLARIRALPATS